MAYGSEDPHSIKKVAARFTSHVEPGDSLIVEMWKEGAIIIYRSKTKERGKMVAKGYVEI